MGIRTFIDHVGGRGTEQTRTVERDLDPADAAKLRVSNLNGDVHVVSGAGSHVTVHATLRTRFGERHFDRVTVDARVDGEYVIVDVNHGDGDEPVRNVRVAVDLVVELPAGIAVDAVESTNGDVALAAVPGDATVTVVNGDVELDGVDGYVVLEATNGDVRVRNCTGIRDVALVNGALSVDLDSVRDDVELSVVNGSIDLRVAPGIDAVLELDTLTGEIAVDADDLPLSDVSRAKQGFVGREYTARIGDGGPTVEVSVITGSIDVGPTPDEE